MRRLPIVFVAALAVLVLPGRVSVWGLDEGGPALPPSQQAAQAPAVALPPSDLRPLLEPRQSEVRLVQAWYAQDRATLAANFLGSMRSSSAAPAVELSPARIARLKRFDLDWQAALAMLESSRLSAKGRSDLRQLTDSVAANLKALDRDAAVLGWVWPLVPFAPPLVQLVEARIRMEDIDAEKAAGVLANVARQIAELTRRIDAAPSASASASDGPLDLHYASRAADAADVLRSTLKEWFTFYNGYDPLFTWWMGVPYKRVDAALEAYGTLLRQKATPGDVDDPSARPASEVAPAPPPKYPSVPDLAMLVGLPQDEMTPIVQRFRTAIGRGGGRGGAPSTAKPAEPPPKPGPEFFRAWLAALKTLDFDALTRNARVDYLFIRRTCEQQLARAGVQLPASPPRKTDASGIPGPARGRQGLLFDLEDEFIPYTPEELIAIGEREFAWCEREMKTASAQMGLGDDWKRAIEKVKEIHPPPGGQVAIVRDLMFEAVDYLRARDLLTIPDVAAESLRMIMMTPERQLVNPFFTGGSLISVSYPHDSMDYDARLQSMRGNNTPFSHATAFHEMIPGHNLVFYTGSRFAGYRPSLAGGSPFYGEGWPLYWEMLLYDLGFHATPEQRVGALFWRMHRCARIVFSLKFHMGEWSPQECIDYLVDRVGFERENATAEVRRSFQGGYGPLYQAAYLLGGLQLRALRGEIVDGRKMTIKHFHDEVLRQGSMPIALLRLAIGDHKLTRDMTLAWRFAEGSR